MQCEAFESRLHSLLDRRQRPELDPQLRAHALGCNHCQQVLDTQECLFGGLDLFEPLDDVRGAPSDVIVKDFLAATEERSKRPNRWIAPLVLLAASLLVISASPWLTNWRSATPTPALAVQEAPAQPTPTAPERPLEAAPTYQFALAFPDQIPTVDALSQLEPQVLSKGLRPLATSFNTALTVIRRTIPGGRATESDIPQAFAHGIIVPRV